MLTFNLNLNWVHAQNRWVVGTFDLSDTGGDTGDGVTSIHELNTALQVVSKLVDVIDIDVVPTGITIVPGTPITKP